MLILTAVSNVLKYTLRHGQTQDFCQIQPAVCLSDLAEDGPEAPRCLTGRERDSSCAEGVVPLLFSSLEAPGRTLGGLRVRGQQDTYAALPELERQQVRFI